MFASRSHWHILNFACVVPSFFQRLAALLNIHTNNLSSWLHLAAIGSIILSEKCLRDPLGVAHRRTYAVFAVCLASEMQLLWVTKSLQGGVVDYLRTLHNNTTGEYACTTQIPAQNRQTLIGPHNIARCWRANWLSHWVSDWHCGSLGSMLLFSVTVSAQRVVVGHV